MAGADIVVIGAGPAGLAAVSCLRRKGFSPFWLDRQGRAGGAYRRMYPDLVLASPVRHSGLPGLALEAPGEYIKAGDYLDYLERLAERAGPGPEQAVVTGIRRASDGFEVSTAQDAGPRRFRTVVVATGMFDFPRSAPLPGLGGPAPGLASESAPRVLHSQAWRGPEAHRGRRLLLVGGGVTGVELAEECATAGLAVTVSARRGRVRLVPQRVLGRDAHDYGVLVERLPVGLFGGFCRRGQPIPGTDLGFSRFQREGLIRVKPDVERFEGRTAVFRDGSREEFDDLVLSTGYRFETPFLPSEVAREPAGHPSARGGESRSWPSLFFLGYPCSRAMDSQYLRGMARDAEALAERLA